MADDLRATGTSFDASNADQVKQRDLAIKRRDLEWRDALQALLATPAGRNWMWNVLAEVNVFSSTFVPGDPHGTSYNEGRRSTALRILADVQRLTPEAFFQMSKENAGK